MSDTDNGAKFHLKVGRAPSLRIAVKTHCYINSRHNVHFMVLDKVSFCKFVLLVKVFDDL